MSSSEKMENSPNDNNRSEGGIQKESEKVYNPIVTIKTKLPPVGDVECENRRSPSPKSVKMLSQLSNHPSTSFTHNQNIEQLRETTDAREVRSLSEDALISPRQLSTTVPVSVPEHLDADGAKNNQGNHSPCAVGRIADFSSPPEGGTVPVIRSLPKNLTETNTPPEKRSAEIDAGSTPIKKLRKTSEGDSGKTGTETESHWPNASLSTSGKTSSESPTNLVQQLKASIQNTEESEFLNTPIVPGKRKRNIARNNSGESKAANDPCFSNLTLLSLGANIFHKSPVSLPMLESEVAVRNNKSPSERQTVSFRDGMNDSNCLAKKSNPDDLVATVDFVTLPMKEPGFTVSDESVDASSANRNLGTRKQNDPQSVSEISDKGPLNSMQKQADTIVHPTVLTDALIGRNDVPKKHRGRQPISDASFEAVCSDLSVEETESAMHFLKLTDNTSSSSKSQNSATVNFEPSTKVKKTRDSVSSTEKKSSSSGADSSNETQILKYSQYTPLILNPHLSPCHLPQQSISSVTDACRVFEIYKSVKDAKIDQNPSNSSLTSTPDTESRSQSEGLPVSQTRSREVHQRSLSDKALVLENSPELTQSIIFQEMSLRSHSEPSTSYKVRTHRRSVSDETLTSRNLTGDQVQDQHNSPVKSRSKETPTSRSLPEISKSVSRATCVVPPLFQRMPARSVSNAPAGTSNSPSTSRNNPEIQLPQGRHARFISGEASTSRNHLEVVSNLNPPHIDVLEGQASTSGYQPIVTGRPSVEQSLFPTSRDGPEVWENTRFPALEEVSTSVRYQSSSTDDSSSDSSDDNYHERPFAMFDQLLPFRFDKHSEYVVEARKLLLRVLKEIMLYNREVIEWNKFAESFGQISEPCSLLSNMNLVIDLGQYLANKAYELGDRILLPPYEMTEMCIQVLYGKLNLMVVNALIFTLTLQSNWNFIGLIRTQKQFRNFFSIFSSVRDITNAQYIQDEASRNRMKALNELIQRLMLVVLMAFRLLLMYVGENVSETILETYLDILSDEDKMYLKRKIN